MTTTREQIESILRENHPAMGELTEKVADQILALINEQYVSREKVRITSINMLDKTRSIPYTESPWREKAGYRDAVTDFSRALLEDRAITSN